MILLATCSTNARELGASIGMGKETVRSHVKAIYRILGIDNRLQLIHLYRDSEGTVPVTDELDDSAVIDLGDKIPESN